MLVKNLDAWAGENISYAYGETIDLPDDTALARIEAGLARAIEQPKKGRKKSENDNNDAQNNNDENNNNNNEWQNNNNNGNQ